MPRVIERTVYTFAELSESAKERARDKYRQDHEVWHEWWDCIYEDAVACSECLGIRIDTHPVKLHGGDTRQDPSIFWSGFCCQGDGAMFTGTYGYKADACAAIAAHAPQDKELAAIAAGLTLMQLTARLQHTNQLGAHVTAMNSRYNHSGCMSVQAFYEDGDDTAPDLTNAVEEELTSLLRRFADWIYTQLRAEDEYLNSDEHVDECLADDEFDEDGDVV